MVSDARSLRRFLHRTAVVVAIVVAAAALSGTVIQPTLTKAIVAVIATLAAVALLPAAWLRFCALIFGMAAFFGLCVIASDYGHHMLDGRPLPRSVNDYIMLGVASTLFAAAWLLWLLLSRRPNKHANSDT
jgi:hypothetical protein